MLFCVVETSLATSKPVQIVLNKLHNSLRWPESPLLKSDCQTLNLCSVSLSFSLFFYSFLFNNSSFLCVVHRRGHWRQPFSLHNSIVLQFNCPFLISFNPYTTPPHLSVQFWPICVPVPPWVYHGWEVSLLFIVPVVLASACLHPLFSTWLTAVKSSGGFQMSSFLRVFICDVRSM